MRKYPKGKYFEKVRVVFRYSLGEYVQRISGIHGFRVDRGMNQQRYKSKYKKPP